jgi:hypothetical protein
MIQTRTSITTTLHSILKRTEQYRRIHEEEEEKEKQLITNIYIHNLLKKKLRYNNIKFN